MAVCAKSWHSPMDRYSFLLIHAGTNDTAKNNFEDITPDFEALGRKPKDFFSYILPVFRRERERKIL